MGAASKRALRALVTQTLLRERNHGADITPTWALHCVKRILGRGVDSHFLLANFAEKGRDASRKTELGVTTLSEIEQALSVEALHLRASLKHTRAKVKAEQQKHI